MRAGRSLYTERIERLIFAELLNATVQNALGEFTSRALSMNYNWIWRDVDDIILPTRGLTSVIQLAGGFDDPVAEGVLLAFEGAVFFFGGELRFGDHGETECGVDEKAKQAMEKRPGLFAFS